jgi:DNA-binding GntR family transcriptional regulator
LNVLAKPTEQAPGARPTRSVTLADALAEAIVAGELAPGKRLDEASLARRYGVSRTPVREALRQLAAIELVDHQPHRGAMVAGIAKARVAELFEALGEAEAACARLAADKMASAERKRLEELHRTCCAAMASGEHEAIPIANRHWHEALYAGARNGFLAEQALSLRRRLAPFTRAQFHLALRPLDSAQEHEQVMEALRRRDAAATAHAMRLHVASVGQSWQKWAAERRATPQPDAAR